ncbi:thermonuclease family protein [Chroococcidiopsidales cyanobacterium LEGE 13417]|nr:thermonuclease family protein [Chroococcidiopsidales cyanobacterium LEGE 13417]
MKRWMIALPILAIALFLLIPKPQHNSKTELPTPSSSPQSKPSPPSAQTWQVIKVADGDTITVTQGDRKEKIRFCGVDANESQQKGGQEAKAYLRSLIDKGDGTVIVNPIEKDRYGRTVAELFVKPRTETPDSHSGEAIFLNGEMVKAGFGRVYTAFVTNCPNREVLEQAEEMAKAQKIGVWGDSASIPPWEWRKQQRQNRGN